MSKVAATQQSFNLVSNIIINVGTLDSPLQMIKNEADLIGKKKYRCASQNQGQECTWTLGYLCPGRLICSILVSQLLLRSRLLMEKTHPSAPKLTYCRFRASKRDQHQSFSWPSFHIFFRERLEGVTWNLVLILLTQLRPRSGIGQG